MTLSRYASALPAPPRLAWATVAALVVAVMLMLSIIFPREALGALHVWMGSRTYNHCFLILPIALFMMWTRRARLSATEIRLEPLAVLSAAVVSVLWSGVAILGILEVQQLVVLTIAQLIFLAAFGTRLYAQLMAPLLYLYFLVPFGDFLTAPLVDFTSSFTLAGLHILGIPVYANGAIIEVRSGIFAIEEACAGLRFLIATIALGVFYACQVYRSAFKRFIFIALCIVVPIIANGFRALGIIVLSELFDNATAIETDHVTYGFVFFSMVLVLLIFVGRIFADPPGLESHVESAPTPRARSSGLALSFNTGISLIATLTGVGSFALLDRAAATALPEKPPAIGAIWQQTSDSAPQWHPLIRGAAREFFDVRTDGGEAVDRFVGVYPAIGPGSKMVRDVNRVFDEKTWQYSGRISVSLTIQNDRVPLTATLIAAGGRKRSVVVFYVVNGRVTANLAAVKLQQFAAHFTKHPCASGLFVLATNADDGHAIAVLQRYLSEMQTPRSYLCGTSSS